MKTKIKPKHDHYIDEDQLGDEYCESMNCRLCFGSDHNGEANGYGCDGRDDFISDNEEIILDFQ